MILIERIKNSFGIYKNKFLIILIICLLSAIISVIGIPLLVNNIFTAEIINNQIGIYSVGLIDIEQVLLALIWMFQLSIISGFLLIIAFIYKYDFEKIIFNIKKWQDWRFFLYVSVIPVLLIDLIKKFELSVNLNIFNNIFSNFFLTLFLSLFVIITSSVLLNKDDEYKI